MKAKAKQLADSYRKEIAEIKRLEAEAEKALADAKNASAGIDDEYEAFLVERQAYQAWQDVKHAANVLREKLAEDVAAEYAAIPYRKAFKKSVDAFFREAGI